MERSEKHEALSVFLGRWSARGISYGGTNQAGNDPKANGEPWQSMHDASWHTGKFFLLQDERADIAGSRFDTFSVMGLDNKGEYFARTFENHGFYRNYLLSRNGNIWTLSGDTERATLQFKDNGRKQVIAWQWKPNEKWLPLCDRIAEKID